MLANRRTQLVVVSVVVGIFVLLMLNTLMSSKKPSNNKDESEMKQNLQNALQQLNQVTKDLQESQQQIADLNKYVAEAKNAVAIREEQKDEREQAKAEQKPPQDKVRILWYTKFFSNQYTMPPLPRCEAWCEYVFDIEKYLHDPSTRGVLFHVRDWKEFPKKTVQNQHFILLDHESQAYWNYPKDFEKHVSVNLHYELDAEVPLLYENPFDALKPPKYSLEEKNKFRNEGYAPVAWIASNCGAKNNRMEYVEALSKHIDIDSYGKCYNTKKFPDGINQKELVARHKFYLAFENSNCKDYVTEKFFFTLEVGSVPVVFGASSISDFAPTKKSIINVQDFKSPKELAKFLTKLDEDDDAYLEYISYKHSKDAQDGFGKVDPAWKNRMTPLVNGWCNLCDYVSSKMPTMTNFRPAKCNNLQLPLE